MRIEPPKAFGGTSSEDVDSWIFSMELYFYAENQITPVQCGLRAALNLSADAAGLVQGTASRSQLIELGFTKNYFIIGL